MLTDLDERELWAYRSTQTEPADFAEFWDKTLTAARTVPLSPVIEDVTTPLTTLRVRDVTFPGYAGDPIRAWLITPAGTTGRLPAVVEYIGYDGGRGTPLDHTRWASCGYAHLVMDTRGQGSRRERGDTPDPATVPSSGGAAITRGIEDPDDYYYRRVFTDAVRAVETIATLDDVDPERIAVTGVSQGGGITLAAAGLIPERIAAVAAFVPFLCDFPRAVRITGAGPYVEVAEYLKVHRWSVERAERTLAYFDGVNMARHATAPGYLSAGLMDEICPPSTVFGAYHTYAGPKELAVWAFNGHDGGGIDDVARAVAHVGAVFGGRE